MQTAVTCEAASRTDRGVHARGQVIAFQAPRLWDPDRLIHALNSTLPSSIRILEARIAPPDFHPSLNALGKEYHYDFYTGPALPPFLRRFCWHYPYPIDPQQIRQAAAFLEGTHDFSSFTTERPEDPVRTVNQIELLAVATDHWRVAIRGDRFLYKMARTLAGTLANVGSGKLPLAAIPELLLRPCRAAAGVTAPAHGLTLHQVCYTIHQK
jgi:tRNA pseudouridine38-40 synthase